jgi:hypothetical protein
MVGKPISKLDDDAFTRMRILLMNAVEQQANRLSHHVARTSAPLRELLAKIRRIEHHQQTMVHWLLPPDLSNLEITLSLEQLAIEVTSMVARQEPDPYLAQVHRFGMLEDFDHLYRFAALYDRVEGKDANVLLQSYTDICPGRPTREHHRDPHDDLRTPYAKHKADAQTKINALSILAAENHVRDFYMTVGPTFSDPVARLVYAEIASVEEQHVTQYESITDPEESLLEKLLLNEVTEVYNYYCCYESETNPAVKKIWERCLNYELGHMHAIGAVFEKTENRDMSEVVPKELPAPLSFTSQRDFVRQVIHNETDMRAAGTHFIDKKDEAALAPDSLKYRERMHRESCPTDDVSAGYRWTPGTELFSDVAAANSNASQVAEYPNG